MIDFPGPFITWQFFSLSFNVSSERNELDSCESRDENVTENEIKVTDISFP